MHLIAQTPRFAIRQFTPEHEETYLDLYNDDEVTLYIPRRTRPENQQIFRENLQAYANNEKMARWGIFNNGDDEYMGFCMLRNYDGGEGQVELGYALTRDFWGKGIASEMAEVMVAYVLTHTDAKTIVAITTLENIASQRVLEKAGFERQKNFLRDGMELAFYKLERV